MVRAPAAPRTPVVSHTVKIEVARASVVVVIGYGPGGKTVLDVVCEPAASLLGTHGPHHAAAVGDGAAGFALGEPLPVRVLTTVDETSLATSLHPVRSRR
jgi:hypothetical protein